MAKHDLVSSVGLTVSTTHHYKVLVYVVTYLGLPTSRNDLQFHMSFPKKEYETAISDFTLYKILFRHTTYIISRYPSSHSTTIFSDI